MKERYSGSGRILTGITKSSLTLEAVRLSDVNEIADHGTFYAESGVKRMTLCLAATCRYKNEPAMVLCCDMAGSRDEVISESSDKLRRIKDSDVLLLGILMRRKNY